MKNWLKNRIDYITYSYNVNRPWFLLRLAQGFAVLAVGTTLLDMRREPEPGVQLAWVQLAWMVIAVGLSLLAGRLLAPKNDSPIKDDKPTTLTTRGSFIPWFVGVRRVGPVFCFVGGREIRKEKIKGAGKGGDDPEADIFYEEGWHVLGIGPVTCLHRIIQSGKTIFTGPITNESHPSGSTIDLGKEGSFTIFWGEAGQPINTFLGNANRVTVSSRWPHTCYIVWNKKRLSTSPTWPILDYVLERRPSQSIITGSSGWYASNNTLSGNALSLFGFLANADEDVGYLEFTGDLSPTLKPKTTVAMVGNGLPDDDYEVLRVETLLFDTGDLTAGGNPIFETHSRVFLKDGTAGADGAGTMEPYDLDETSGANVAHVIAELLFAPFPQGLAIDPDHIVEKWDLPSLEELGTEAQTNLWRTSVIGQSGETAEALLAAMLQDHGTMLPIDTATGNLLFKRVREPSGTLPNLTDAIYANRQPEIEVVQGEQPVDRLIFSFNDRTKEFGDMTITVDEDGQASFMEHQRARTVPIVSTVNFATAASLAELRKAEELAPGAEFRIDAGREARDFIPGDQITASGFVDVLLVVSVEIDPLSERVSLKVLPDFYGVPLSTFVTKEGNPIPTVQAPEQELQAVWVEVPEHLLGSFPQTLSILTPHIRAHNLMTFASVWLSRDDITYLLTINDTFVQTGGTLDDALLADGPTYTALGPEYSELGPDNAALTQDLSSDLTNWGLGRQVVIIVSSAGVEICFAQKATITGGSTRRLDGFLRARYHTRKLAHPVGAKVFISDKDSVTAIADILLEPTKDLSVKLQSGSTAGQVNLSAVPPWTEPIRGEGQVPIKPDYVYCRAPFRNTAAFQTGDNIDIAWAISTAASTGTGAGYQSSGVAISDPVIPGTVQIELLTTGDTVQSTVSVQADGGDQFTITNAALVAAFTSEPSAFKVRVTHIANGQSSPVSDSLTITRV